MSNPEHEYVLKWQVDFYHFVVYQLKPASHTVFKHCNKKCLSAMRISEHLKFVILLWKKKKHFDY
jgi:hypothetical protein